MQEHGAVQKLPAVAEFSLRQLAVRRLASAFWACGQSLGSPERARVDGVGSDILIALRISVPFGEDTGRRSFMADESHHKGAGRAIADPMRDFGVGQASAREKVPRGPDWNADAFTDASGANALLMIAGVGHGLGGIAGLDAIETEAEVPDTLEATRRLTFAWLSRSLGIEAETRDKGRMALRDAAADLASLAEK
ncbi:hypothetical protein ACSSVY_001537 [Roseovarius sp. MBR-51]